RYVNAGPVGNFFKKVGQSISKPLQPQPEPQPQSTRPQPTKTPHATRRPTSRAAPAAAATPPGVAQPSQPPQRRRVYWHRAGCFSRGYGKSKSWFALWNSGPWPERHGHESLYTGRGQVYRCHRFCVWVRRERSIHRKVFSGSVNLGMELTGSATRLRRGYGVPSIEGKAPRVRASKLGGTAFAACAKRA